MRAFQKTGRLALIILLATVVGSVSADSEQKLVLIKNSSIEISGTSTLHPWNAKNTESQIDSAISVKQTLPAGTNALPLMLLDEKTFSPKISSLKVQIVSEKFKSKELGFDGPLHNALKAKTYPLVTFDMGSGTIQQDGSNPGHLLFKTDGTLTIAGVEKKISLDATGVISGNTIRVTGQKDLLMTEYGIATPTMFGGVVKTGDKVVVKWDLLFTLSTPAGH